MPKKSEPGLLDALSATERLRIAPMAEAAHLSGVSKDHLVRHYAEYIIKLGPRRNGMRVMHALMLREEPNPPTKGKRK